MDFLLCIFFFHAILVNDLHLYNILLEVILTNLVQLVRFALGKDDTLEEFDKVANQRFNLWKGRQLKKGIHFTDEQNEWLERIKDYIVANAYMSKTDIQEAMDDKGGIFKARQVFGTDLDNILEDMNLALVA